MCEAREGHTGTRMIECGHTTPQLQHTRSSFLSTSAHDLTIGSSLSCCLNAAQGSRLARPSGAARPARRNRKSDLRRFQKPRKTDFRTTRAGRAAPTPPNPQPHKARTSNTQLRPNSTQSSSWHAKVELKARRQRRRLVASDAARPERTRTRRESRCLERRWNRSCQDVSDAM